MIAPIRIGHQPRDRRWSGWPNRFLIVVLVAGMAGCASPPSATYDLNAAAALAPASVPARAPRGPLAIATPTALSLIDSQRIVIRTGSELAYLKGAQWTGRLPDLLWKRLVESFEQSHRFAAVGAAGLDAKYTLETDILRFEVDVSHNTAIVEIYARLLTKGGQILAAQDFTGDAPAPHDDGAAVTSALDQALAKVLHQIVAWTAPKV